MIFQWDGHDKLPVRLQHPQEFLPTVRCKDRKQQVHAFSRHRQMKTACYCVFGLPIPLGRLLQRRLGNIDSRHLRPVFPLPQHFGHLRGIVALTAARVQHRHPLPCRRQALLYQLLPHRVIVSPLQEGAPRLHHPFIIPVVLPAGLLAQQQVHIPTPRHIKAMPRRAHQPALFPAQRLLAAWAAEYTHRFFSSSTSCRAPICGGAAGLRPAPARPAGARVTGPCGAGGSAAPPSQAFLLPPV